MSLMIDVAMTTVSSRGAARKAPHRQPSQPERSAGPASRAKADADAGARARTDATKGLGHNDTSRRKLTTEPKKPAVALAYA